MNTIQANALRRAKPAPMLIAELVPQGIVFLAGRPKSGKSWLALDLSVCVAAGWDYANRPTTQGRVLYIGREDTLDRFGQRLAVMVDGTPPPALAITTDRPSLDDLRRYCVQTNPALIVIDTWQAWTQGSSTYSKDYAAIDDLRTLAQGRTCLIVHHTRKAKGGYALDNLLGSSGLSGAADAVLVLATDGNRGTLETSGRDVPRQTIDIRLTKEGRPALAPPSVPYAIPV